MQPQKKGFPARNARYGALEARDPFTSALLLLFPLSFVIPLAVILWLVLLSGSGRCRPCSDRGWDLEADTIPAPLAFAQQNASGVGVFSASGLWRTRPVSHDCATLGEWSAWSSDDRMELPAGHYEVQLLGQATVPVSVGNVYFTAGQSNSLLIGSWGVSECDRLHHSGTAIQKAAGDEPWPPQWNYGMQVCGAPMLGDLLQNNSVPVAFVQTGYYGRPVSNWTTELPLRNRLLSSLATYQPVAVLWHQGESDEDLTPVDEYEAMLTQLILDAQAVWNATWVVAQVSESTIPAQRAVAHTLSNVYEGPNTLETLHLPGCASDAVHFTCRGMQVNAQLWYQSLQAAGAVR